MKTSYKNKAVIVFFLTICLLGRGSYSVSAKNSLKNNHGDKTRYVVVCGTPVGIRLKSHGVIITGFIGYTTENNEYFSLYLKIELPYMSNFLHLLQFQYH